MVHLNIVSGIMLTAGAGTSYLAVVEPKDLEGLGPTALLALITLASLATLVYLMKCFIPPMNELVKEIAKNTASTSALVGRRAQDTEEAKQVVKTAAAEAKSIISNAATEAKEIIHLAATDAVKHVKDAAANSGNF